MSVVKIIIVVAFIIGSVIMDNNIYKNEPILGIYSYITSSLTLALVVLILWFL